MPILKTDQLMGDYVHVTKAAVAYARKKGKLNKGPKGYDTDDPLNQKYIHGDSIKALAQRGIIINQSEDAVPMTNLDIEKQRQDILYKKKQNRRLDYDHSVKTKNTIPVEAMTLWIGAFRAGIETNFLTIARRIARGDKELEARIDKDVSKAIAKTKEGAAKALRDESPAIMEAINGTEDK